MLDRLAAFIVGEGNWLPMAMGAAFLAAAWLGYSTSGSGVPQRNRILAMMNLFTGAMLLVMGFGHLLAVTTKFLLSTQRGSLGRLYLIGIAIVVPAWMIASHTQAILLRRGDEGHRTTRLNLWMAATLVLLGLINIPLAMPALLTLAYGRHSRTRSGVIIVVAFVLVNLGLLTAGMLFMLSGARTFEEFNM